MKKRQEGILTVEASISLTLMVLFMLFLFSFARVYRAQSVVSHGVIQSADAIALESYLREAAYENDAASTSFWLGHLTGQNDVSAESLTRLKDANIGQLAKQKFIAAVADSSAHADAKLQKLGVKNGLSGVQFTVAYLDETAGDVVLGANYTVELQFPLFGARELALTKTAKAKTFGNVRYSISGTSNNMHWGTVTGSGRYENGQSVIIEAKPEPGFRFVRWSDGSTDPKRVIPVNGNADFEAIFEPVQVTIRITGGMTGDASTTFTAVVEPADAAVSWSVSDGSILSLSPSENTCTVTAIGSNNSCRFLEVFTPNQRLDDDQGNTSDPVQLTAHAEYYGTTADASVQIVTMPAVVVENFYYYKTNQSDGGRKSSRNYYAERLPNEFTQRYQYTPNGAENSERRYYYGERQGCWHRTLYVTRAELESAEQLAPGAWLADAPDRCQGYNMTGYNGTSAQNGYVLWFDESTRLPFFITGQKGSGDYYIASIY